MASLEEFCKISATLKFNVIGPVPTGTRIDVDFVGTVTSSHWEGELPVSGVDYITVQGDGNMGLEIRARIGEGKGMVAYSATGLSIGGEDGVANIQELVRFETANEDLAFLNGRVGVAIGTGKGPKLDLTVYLVAS